MEINNSNQVPPVKKKPMLVDQPWTTWLPLPVTGSAFSALSALFFLLFLLLTFGSEVVFSVK